jgi:hypothetical protein
LDAQERRALCDLFEDLGADAPTLLPGSGMVAIVVALGCGMNVRRRDGTIET